MLSHSTNLGIAARCIRNLANDQLRMRVIAMLQTRIEIFMPWSHRAFAFAMHKFGHRQGSATTRQ